MDKGVSNEKPNTIFNDLSRGPAAGSPAFEQLRQSRADRSASPDQSRSSRAGEWQTYTNAEAGVKLQMPPNWSQTTLPDQNNGALHTIAFSGPEGRVEVSWGKGFGGACPTGTTPVKLAEAEKLACYINNSDGTEAWGQIGYEASGGNAFLVRPQSIGDNSTRVKQ